MYQSDEDGGAGAGRVPHSVREKLSAEFGLRDESACLAVNGLKRAAVDLVMIGNGQGLGPTTLQHAADLDVAASLGEADRC